MSSRGIGLILSSFALAVKAFFDGTKKTRAGFTVCCHFFLDTP